MVVCGDLKNGRTIHSSGLCLGAFRRQRGDPGGQWHGVAAVRHRDAWSANTIMVSRRWRRAILNAVVTETDALYLTPKQPHQLALFTQVDKVIQSQLSSMATGLRYDAFYMTRKQKERMKDGAASGSYPTIGAGVSPGKALSGHRGDASVAAGRRAVAGSSTKTGAASISNKRPMACRCAWRCSNFSSTAANNAHSAPRNGAVGPLRSPEPIGPQCRNANCMTVKEPVSTERRFRITFARGYRRT